MPLSLGGVRCRLRKLLFELLIPWRLSRLPKRLDELAAAAPPLLRLPANVLFLSALADVVPCVIVASEFCVLWRLEARCCEFELFLNRMAELGRISRFFDESWWIMFEGMPVLLTWSRDAYVMQRGGGN